MPHDGVAVTAAIREKFSSQAAPEVLNRWVAGGDRALATRFSQRERLADYASLLAEVEND